MGGREGEDEDEERDVGEDEQEEETDRDVTGDQPRQRQSLAGLSGSFDLAPGHVSGDDRDDAPQAPGAEDRRRRE